MFDEFEITGRTRRHVVQIETPRFAAHPDVVRAFLLMRAAAAVDGIDLRPYSSFRGHAAQLRIWNRKFAGDAPLFDIDGNIRDRTGFDTDETIHRILDWSALPGASRHQWGTEIDVVDGAAMSPGYKPLLLPREVREGGLFAPLHAWLDRRLHEFGFFRPYARFQGGMYPEPWHLSYGPLALRAIDDLSVDLLRRLTAASDIAGKERVLELLPGIHTRHVLNITLPPPAFLRDWTRR